MKAAVHHTFLLSVSFAFVLLFLECRAEELTVANRSFENPSVAEGGFSQGAPPGWTGDGIIGAANPDDAFFPGTSAGSPGPNPIDGLNAASINYGGRLSFQDGRMVVRANVVYTLTLLAGHRSDTPFGFGSMSLWAGTDLLAERIPNPPAGSFIFSSLSFTSPPAGPAIGMPLRIELSAPTPNSQTWFDDVHLFAEDLVCTPHKAIATAQLFNGIFVGALLTDSGCGYTNPPTVTIQGGGGQGATATALLFDGRVSEIRVSNGGCCYTNLPTVVIDSPPRVPTVAISISRVKVTQNVTTGRRYVLESSLDLSVWTPTGPAFTANSDTVVDEYDVDVTGRYFRLREVQ